MATNHGRACFSTRRPHAPGAYATGRGPHQRGSKPGFGGLLWASVGFCGLWWFCWVLLGFGGLYRALSGFIGFIGFWWVLSGFVGFYAAIFFVSSTPGAGAGGCRNRRTKTHAHETTYSTRALAVGSHDVAIDGSLVDVPTRASAAVHSLLPVEPLFVRRSARVRAPDGVGGVCSGGAWRRLNRRARLLTRRSITGAVRPVAHTEPTAPPP